MFWSRMKTRKSVLSNVQPWISEMEPFQFHPLGGSSPLSKSFMTVVTIVLLGFHRWNKPPECWLTGVGNCPNSTLPNYLGYHLRLQQIFAVVMWNKSPKTLTKPWFLKVFYLTQFDSPSSIRAPLRCAFRLGRPMSATRTRLPRCRASWTRWAMASAVWRSSGTWCCGTQKGARYGVRTCQTWVEMDKNGQQYVNID